MNFDFDVLCVGNAIMDVLSPCDETFLKTHNIEKGGMNLIDEARAISLYEAMPEPTQQSGGSAANSAYGLACLGGQAAFAGQVATDSVGDAFIADLQAANVHFAGRQAPDGPATARSMIFVTPDTIRSMNTFLGSSLLLNEEHLNQYIKARYIYLEGYLFDAPKGPEIFHKAAEIASLHGGQIALSLSDAWCVERHHQALSEFIEEHVSILFSNNDEINALGYETIFDASQALSEVVDDIIVTLGADGAMVATAEQTVSVPAMPVGEVVDTTGAGDLFAAGYLYGKSTDADILTAAEYASLCAGEIICHFGARPKSDLKKLISAAR